MPLQFLKMDVTPTSLYISSYHFVAQMKSSTIRTIFFDLDGTIVDSEAKAVNVVQRIMPNYLGRTLTGVELRNFKGVPWLGAFREMLPGREYEIYEECLKEWDRIPTKLNVYSGIVEEIKHLNRMGFTLGIVSSKESRYIHMDLEDFSISDYFSVVIGSDDTLRHKPNPDPLIEAARRINRNPADCIYIGDQPTDMSAARMAGMRCGGALWGDGEYEYLKDSAPDFMFKDPADITENLIGLSESRAGSSQDNY